MARRGLKRADVAGYVEVATRTVTNWTTGQTMPSAIERERLRDLLGDYDAIGDPVEVAIRQSELHEWRQDAVLSEYKRHLYQQRAEVTGT